MLEHGFVWLHRAESLRGKDRSASLCRTHFELTWGEPRGFWTESRSEVVRVSTGFRFPATRRTKSKPPYGSTMALTEVRCKRRLGGLLKHYYRQAA